MSNRPDIDPQETQEWLDALEGVLENEGVDRAHFLIEKLVDKARRSGAHLPFSANTAYVNTIPLTQQKRFPVPSIFTFLDGLFSFTSTKTLEQEVQKIAATTVAEAMTADPVHVGPDATVEEIASLMVEKHFHTIPVVDKDKLVGVLGKEDVLKMLVDGNTSR